ncbi:hypothetical protein [Castellaniella sp.]|uniref:tellurite resistance TerB family protein n=1 Tax=Castellaniella sp. TaxID=1955812 RepID=UPI002AFF74B1|nr:hypothetical protein [Castellaniella sp.]
MPHRLSEAFIQKDRHAPELDVDDTGVAVLVDDDQIIGGLFGIEYRDSKGGISTRDILVHAVKWQSSRLQISAHCLLRNQYRSFVAQNIIALAHGRTGEIIGNPVAFFSTLAPQPETAELSVVTPHKARKSSGFAKPKPLNIPAIRKELRELIRPAAVLLMAVAHADGRLCNDEIQVIADLVWEGARKTYTIHQTDMLTDMVVELTALQPSDNMITRALNLTLDKGPFPPDLPAWLSRMARADGVVVNSEKDRLTDILTTLRRLAAKRQQTP